MSAIQDDRIREGLMLCMMLSSVVSGKPRPEELREMAIVASEEPEFQKRGMSFDQLLEESVKVLHRDPEDIVMTIGELLKEPEERRRGLQLAARIVVADGFVRTEHARLLEEMRDRLGLSEADLRDVMVTTQQRLVRFMMVYLIYLTATSDGVVAPEEFEQMIPFALNLPVFKGISGNQFRFISESVRTHLDSMTEEWGLDYLCGTLIKGAELLEDPTIIDQALKLVAHGIIADDQFQPGEREFFLKLAKKLGREVDTGERLIDETIRESKELKKI